MNRMQQAIVDYLKNGRRDVQFEVQERGNKVWVNAKGAKPWPDIVIGSRGGVEIGVRSYDQAKKVVEEWALEADRLLEKQVERDVKKPRIKELKLPDLLENYMFFAAAYLNDWWQYDSVFFIGLQASKSRDARLYWLRQLAAYYQVNRNLKKKHEGGGPRLAEALTALDGVSGPITEDNVDFSVLRLVKLLKETYKSTLISAASKFLWALHRSPVAIYDSRARATLNQLSGTNMPEEDYVSFRKEWLKQFDQRKSAIGSACDKLLCMREFAPFPKDERALECVVKAQWFHERVFDKFLWWNGREYSPE